MCSMYSRTDKKQEKLQTQPSATKNRDDNRTSFFTAVSGGSELRNQPKLYMGSLNSI